MEQLDTLFMSTIPTGFPRQQYVELTLNTEFDYYINAVAVLLCLLLGLFMFIHTMYQWIYRTRNMKPDQTRKIQPSPIIMYRHDRKQSF